MQVSHLLRRRLYSKCSREIYFRFTTAQKWPLFYEMKFNQNSMKFLNVDSTILGTQRPQQSTRFTCPSRCYPSESVSLSGGIRHSIARFRFYHVTSARASLNLTKIGVKSDARYARSRWDNQATTSGVPLMGHLRRDTDRPTPIGNRGRDERGKGERRVIRHLPFHYCLTRGTAAWHAIARSIPPLVFASVRAHRRWAYAKSCPITRT